ncbi:retinoic acid early-inducible protein 1-alpha-like [Microtus pennsylvanicus]|uniref:retinoic acid early-inducible protein 1-alpha-like n=1 Tax=Microtus pennsylvanicus TaxID=10058 RepID=UPI003F6D6F19
MAKALTSVHSNSQHLCLWLLLICLVTTVLADAHSLTCDVIVKASTTPGQSWCEGQCSVDGEPFLQYDNDNKATPLVDLRNATNGTQVWTDMTQKLEYLWKELRKMLANTKKEITKISGQPTLQATMLSQYEQEQIVDASWRFNISGKYSFILNTMNMNWTLIDHEAGGIMNKWKEDKQLIKDLKTISTADCSYWLKELLKHQKEKPRPTSRTPDITQFPFTSQFRSKEESAVRVRVIPIIVLAVFVCICICIYMKRKFHPQRNRNLQLPTNCPINCHKPQRKERPMEPNGEFPNQETKMLSQEDETKTPENGTGSSGTAVAGAYEN